MTFHSPSPFFIDTEPATLFHSPSAQAYEGDIVNIPLGPNELIGPHDVNTASDEWMNLSDNKEGGQCTFNDDKGEFSLNYINIGSRLFWRRSQRGGTKMKLLQLATFLTS